MPTIVTLNGSPSPNSRTAGLLNRVARELGTAGYSVDHLDIRELPAGDLISRRVDSPELARALLQVERAGGVVIGTPIYKAAYTGLLKAFLDLLPQFGLEDKVVLPLATGGSFAHVLAIDYALRPVLASLGARHVVAGYFVLDKAIQPRFRAPRGRPGRYSRLSKARRAGI